MYKFTKSNILNALEIKNFSYPFVEMIEIKCGSDINSYDVIGRGFDKSGYVLTLKNKNNTFELNTLVSELINMNVRTIKTRTENLLKDISSNHEPVLGKIVTFEIK